MKKDLQTSIADFKSGKGEIPKLTLRGEAKAVDGKIKLILTKEVYDRDGELIDVDGMDIANFLKNPVLLDAHQMMGSVVETVLGKIHNLTKTADEAGTKMIIGEPEFAPTPNGQIAKSLVDNGFVRTVSVGFGVKDYDHETRRITASELYEVSLVSVPANTMATISKSLKADESEVAEKLDAALKNREEIRIKIKEYRRLFMGDEFIKELGIEKSGNELLDMKVIYDKLILRLKSETQEQPEQKEPETPEPQTDTKDETITITPQELQDMIQEAVKDFLN